MRQAGQGLGQGLGAPRERVLEHPDRIVAAFVGQKMEAVGEVVRHLVDQQLALGDA